VDHPRADAIGEGWTGWVVFAALIMVLLGLYHVGTGLAALFGGSIPFADRQTGPFAQSPGAWGVTHVVFGVLYVVAGYFLLRGRLWARILTVAVCFVDVVDEFFFLRVTPLWSLMVIALGVITMYAVAVHGGRDTLE
jgi:uncharacterized membrane protein (UPF0136 family)